ncbi:MAG: hypothetical protein AAGA81_09215 [Acidobacteriota bacterium]
MRFVPVLLGAGLGLLLGIGFGNVGVGLGIGAVAGVLLGLAFELARREDE